jgi:hypothetical protein
MNRQVIARLLLPVLLLGQPGGAALAHAIPVGASASGAASAQAGHCAHRSEAAGAAQGAGTAASSHGADDYAPPGSDCRAHASCSCDCAGASAIAAVRSDAPQIIPDHPAVIGIVAPRMAKRVVELLRPPI